MLLTVSIISVVCEFPTVFLLAQIAHKSIDTAREFGCIVYSDPSVIHERILEDIVSGNLSISS